jgi:hypothetical protein
MVVTRTFLADDAGYVDKCAKRVGVVLIFIFHSSLGRIKSKV